MIYLQCIFNNIDICEQEIHDELNWPVELWSNKKIYLATKVNLIRTLEFLVFIGQKRCFRATQL